MTFMTTSNRKALTLQQKKKMQLLDFFITCNKVGFFTLGGGYAMIPIMEKEFVDKHHWMDHGEFMDVMVVAQTTPGIFSIDMASHTGYKIRGVWGGIVGALGIATPSIIAILLIAIFFHSFKSNPYVEHFFMGVHPAVVALIASPCFTMAKTARLNRYSIWIPVVCCLLISAWGVSPIWLIIIAGVSGFVWGRYTEWRKCKKLKETQQMSKNEQKN